MEEYLQNLRSLRSQINDIEEVAAKRSVEEQSQKTAIETLEKDIFSVASETTRLNAESKELEKERAQICGQIFEKQEKISSLENETSTLSQSLELLRQQIVSASEGLQEKRMYFAKIMEDSVFKLQQGHDWLNSYEQKITTANLVEEHYSPSSEMNLENMRDTWGMSYQKLTAQVESKKAKHEELKARKSELGDENAKSKQLMVELEQKTESFTPALKALDVEALEEEHKALLADEAGELEYLKSLDDQITQLKSVSHAVKCQCGEEYMVELEG
ncbi:uncharacterized protein YGR130C isoform X1 [Dendrobium catenatum]|uniref:Uncharacterized protein n=1 Tax=Dendrobium catenatum TaxID=906689 RepID=A0A2I0WFX4_9ASPA|nr:uncharacterized protein YGR130C isoform X1 [Dendrobium catenatum]PKU74553.1 hypothetical protein MA16_Dca003756 [Dendrobium catenatum]